MLGRGALKRPPVPLAEVLWNDGRFGWVFADVDPFCFFLELCSDGRGEEVVENDL